MEIGGVDPTLLAKARAYLRTGSDEATIRESLRRVVRAARRASARQERWILYERFPPQDGASGQETGE